MFDPIFFSRQFLLQQYTFFFPFLCLGKNQDSSWFLLQPPVRLLLGEFFSLPVCFKFFSLLPFLILRDEFLSEPDRPLTMAFFYFSPDVT